MLLLSTICAVLLFSLCFRQMAKKSCFWRAACAPHQEKDHSKIRGEAGHATKHKQSSSSGPNAPPKKKTWKRYLTFLSKFQNKMKHKKPDARAPSSFKQGSPKRSSRAMLEDCVNMVRVIRRTAADCFASAVAGGDEDDELPCYVQLDQVSYGVRREAYGPIYLVT